MEVINRPDGRVLVESTGDGRTVTVEPADTRSFLPYSTCETDYSLDLIETLATVKGVRYLCEEIVRTGARTYLRNILECSILGYVAPSDWRGKRILDFGCGCGASTVLLDEILPGAELVGVDLDPGCVSAARRRAQHHGALAASFEISPDSRTLPEGLGEFDAVVLSGVYEHLLPGERVQLLRQLWSRLRPEGILFLNDTPNRDFPIESHTTRLPLLNYLPSGAALRIAQQFARNVPQDQDWDTLLRRGIRGGTRREILRQIGDDRARLLIPHRMAFRDEIDLWYRLSTGARPRHSKRVLRWALKALHSLLGVTLTPSLSLAIQK